MLLCSHLFRYSVTIRVHRYYNYRGNDFFACRHLVSVTPFRLYFVSSVLVAIFQSRRTSRTTFMSLTVGACTPLAKAMVCAVLKAFLICRRSSVMCTLTSLLDGPYLASINVMLGEVVKFVVAGTQPRPREESFPDCLSSVETKICVMYQEVDSTCPKNQILNADLRRTRGMSRTLECRVTVLCHICRQDHDTFIVLQVSQEDGHKRVPLKL